jgi:uncharacterized protein (DUF1330 family)
MPAYAIVDLDVHDIAEYLRYQRAVRPLLEAVGARYLARGGEFTVFAGEYQPDRLMVVEFPSLRTMQAFYGSDPYLALESQRLACSSANIVGVEGCGPLFPGGPTRGAGAAAGTLIASDRGNRYRQRS